MEKPTRCGHGLHFIRAHNAPQAGGAPQPRAAGEQRHPPRRGAAGRAQRSIAQPEPNKSRALPHKSTSGKQKQNGKKEGKREKKKKQNYNSLS